MGLALLKSASTQIDVEIAWATMRALILAEVDDPTLQDDLTHQQAIDIAKHRFKLLYADWSAQ